jgi:hypothetical protein
MVRPWKSPSRDDTVGPLPLAALEAPLAFGCSSISTVFDLQPRWSRPARVQQQCLLACDMHQGLGSIMPAAHTCSAWMTFHSVCTSDSGNSAPFVSSCFLKSLTLLLCFDSARTNSDSVFSAMPVCFSISAWHEARHRTTAESEDGSATAHSWATATAQPPRQAAPHLS